MEVFFKGWTKRLKKKVEIKRLKKEVEKRGWKKEVQKRGSKKRLGNEFENSLKERKTFDCCWAARSFGFQSFAEENETQVWSNKEN